MSRDRRPSSSSRVSRPRPPATCTSATSSTRFTCGASRAPPVRGVRLQPDLGACCCASRITIGIAAGRRSRSGILEDLAWLGFVADEPSRQAERSRQPVRIRARSVARARAGVRVRLFAVRDRAAERDRASRYPGTCADKGLAESPGLGIRVRLEPARRAVRRLASWAAGAAAVRAMRRSAGARSRRQLDVSVRRGRRRLDAAA